jgi:hypothetical protein
LQKRRHAGFQLQMRVDGAVESPRAAGADSVFVERGQGRAFECLRGGGGEVVRVAKLSTERGVGLLLIGTVVVVAVSLASDGCNCNCSNSRDPSTASTTSPLPISLPSSCAH